MEGKIFWTKQTFPKDKMIRKKKKKTKGARNL